MTPDLPNEDATIPPERFFIVLADGSLYGVTEYPTLADATRVDAPAGAVVKRLDTKQTVAFRAASGWITEGTTAA